MDDHDDSPGVFKSLVMFTMTMGTVFGLGMAWTTWGDDVIAAWNRDMDGMKSDWARMTSPKKKERKGLMGAFGSAHQARFDDIADELESNRRDYDFDFGPQETYTPMIDDSRP